MGMFRGVECSVHGKYYRGMFRGVECSVHGKYYRGMLLRNMSKTVSM